MGIATGLSVTSILGYPEIELQGGESSSQHRYCSVKSTNSTPQEYTAMIGIHEEKRTNSESMHPVTVFVTADPSTAGYLGVSDYVTTNAAKSQEEAKQKIEQLAQTAGKDNWDGEGGSKILPETIKAACEILAKLPHNVLGEDLDIDATPFGSIDFGWVLERDVMMNIIVLPSGEIGFAYSVHGERNDGKVLWEGTLPLCISEAVDRVFHREELDG